MSRDAIAALTDLTYHFSTTLLANDLVAFSKHAKRQTVKTDDVLLMARKDRKGMMAELKRVMAENPDRYSEGGAKNPIKSRVRSKSTGGRTRRTTAATTTTTTTMTAASLAARKRASASKSSHRSSNKTNKRLGSSSKGFKNPGNQSILSSSSSSTSDDSNEDPVVARRRNKLELERRNLNKGAFRSSGNDANTAKSGDDGFENDGSSSSDVEFDFGANKGNGSHMKKNSLRNNNDLTDSNGRSNDRGEKKNSSSMFQIDGDSEDYATATAKKNDRLDIFGEDVGDGFENNDSSSDIDIDFGATKKRSKASISRGHSWKKKPSRNKDDFVDPGGKAGGRKKKDSDSIFQIDGDSEDNDNMVIDLASD